MTITLTALKREETGKRGKRALSAGSMPAVVYGPKQEALSVALELKAFEKVLRDVGESSVVELTGLGSPLQVLIHEIDRDPVTHIPRHADFYAIEKGAKVEVAIPLEFIGESAAVKAGANLVKVMHELEIEASPADLPHDLKVDISSLVEVGSQIHVSDIALPKGVTTKVESDQVVALIQEVTIEEEAPAAVDMASIEVERRAKRRKRRLLQNNPVCNTTAGSNRPFCHIGKGNEVSTSVYEGIFVSPYRARYTWGQYGAHTSITCSASHCRSCGCRHICDSSCRAGIVRARA
jgi:large subunit ribosomal protein L25